MSHTAACDASEHVDAVAQAAREQPRERHAPSVERADLLRIGLVAVAAALVWARVWEPAGRVDPLGVAATLLGGYPIFKEAFENLFERRMTMELSMTLAIGAALGIGETFTALVITLFVLVAEILEGLTVSRGRIAIADLLDVLPRVSTVRRDGATAEVATGSLLAGDVVLIAPGAQIPVDGAVLAGRSFVDQARITGESFPVEKTAGSAVFAGTINQSGALELRTERVGPDTSFGKIVAAVETAERSRAPVQRLADRLAGYLVYFALGAAALTFAVTRDVRSTIAVIIVAGACGIAAGTPLALLGAMGRAARAGAIVKGGRFLEALANVDAVAFDKTGTLTLGVPEIVALEPADGIDPGELVALAAVAELRSEHPLGKAIVRRADALGLALTEPDDFAYEPGAGITAHSRGAELVVGSARYCSLRGIAVASASSGGATAEVVVARDGAYVGRIRVADALRPEAARALRDLHALGVRTLLLSGDARAVAEAVARELGIDEVAAELLPVEKAAKVASLVAEGHVVAMVGDGVNDAPALAAASVGVAMGSGTDVAQESAGVVLLGNDLVRFVETLRIARRTKAIVMQNFVGTLAVDTVGIALAACGLLSPLFAAFVHVASELAFILNSTRMLPLERVRTSPERR